jgi:hypothetical protein
VQVRGRSRIGVGLLVAALIAVGGGVTAATADTSYPSWGDVQAAKASQAATEAEVTRINAVLGQLQRAAASASDLAIRRAGQYAKAQADLAAATDKATRLASSAAAAGAAARSLKTQSGALTEQLSRISGADLTIHLFLDGTRTAGSPDLLYQLGAMASLTGRAGDLFMKATQQQNLASSLSGDAKSAESARASLAVQAQKALSAAQAAQRAADAELATQRTRATVMYAQLASLKRTTAKVEEKYAEGVAAAAALAQQQASSGSADSFAPPLGGVNVDPAGAQAYAQSALPSYGWGADQMSCLVRLWNQESGWRADAYNTSSGAYGIPQSLPASKMSTAGPDWQTNARTQINWGLSYISRAYGSPCGAWNHEMGYNWY